MVPATVRIPSLLAQVGDGRTVISVEAATVMGALEALFSQLPQLRVHVFDESGGVRPHVALFHGDHTVRGPHGLAAELASGDVVTVLQAVSGG